MMTDDVVFLDPGKAPMGREEFIVNFQEAHGRVRIDCRTELEEVTVVGEIAYLRGRDTLSVTPHEGGATEHMAGYRLAIFLKQPPGNWLLARVAHTVL